MSSTMVSDLPLDRSKRTSMRTVVMREFGAPEVLVVEDMTIPDPGPGEVRVRVHAVVVNTARDVLTRSGAHIFSRVIKPPHILGGEHAGVVDEVGAGVDRSLVGSRVVASAVLPCGDCDFCLAGLDERCRRPQLIGVHRPGAYSEYATAPVGALRVVPPGLSFVDAAVLMTTGPVGLAQVNTANLENGDVLVVPGVAGALGSMVAALAASRGVRVVGLTRDVARTQRLSVPVDALVDACGDDLALRLSEACAPSGAHAVVDNVCVQPVWDACLGVLRDGGRVVISGQLGDSNLSVDARRLYLANQSIIGVRTASREMEELFWNEVQAGFRLPDGLVETFPLTAAADVHRLVENGEKVGHFALLVDELST
jgi:NADPH:quinone reductase-like Zn-dependent oxidoreductase